MVAGMKKQRTTIREISVISAALKAARPTNVALRPGGAALIEGYMLATLAVADALKELRPELRRADFLEHANHWGKPE